VPIDQRPKNEENKEKHVFGTKMCLVSRAGLEDIIDLEDEEEMNQTCPELGYSCQCSAYCMDCAFHLLDDETKAAWEEEKKTKYWEEQGKKWTT